MEVVHQTPLTEGDISETVELFKRLLRCETVNPPGNERIAIDVIAEVLAAEGIESTILESAPGRANLIARLKGGSEPALMLTGHVDVVEVERESWSVDPFAAEEKDGWIYGRGAVDMKHHVAMCIAALINLKRRNVQLNRDVVLVCVADEEMGSDMGMRWLVDNHADLLEAGFGLNEFGGFNIHLPGGKQAYLVQTSERGFCWFTIRATGVPGHGSLPPLDSAVATLTSAVQRLCNGWLPHHLTPPGKQYLNALGRAMGPAGIATKLLQNRLTESFALSLFPDREQAHSVATTLHNTAVPTVLRSGDKTNVLPGSASCQIDGRYLPGFTQEQFLAEVRQVIGDGLEIEVHKGGPPSVMSTDTDLFRLIGNVIGDRADGAPTIPWLMGGFSDTKWLQDLDMQVYGFSPAQFPADVSFAKLPHGHDERIPRAGYEWGIETFWQTVCQFCSV